MLKMNVEKQNALPLELSFEEVEDDAVIIDCRKVDEFECGHLNGAQNIPLQHISISKESLPCSEEDKIVVYCRTGNRSLTFATYLRSIGYQHCQSIAGGYESFEDKL